VGTGGQGKAADRDLRLRESPLNFRTNGFTHPLLVVRKLQQDM
jgi:hypothetical protein